MNQENDCRILNDNFKEMRDCPNFETTILYFLKRLLLVESYDNIDDAIHEFCFWLQFDKIILLTFFCGCILLPILDKCISVIINFILLIFRFMKKILCRFKYRFKPFWNKLEMLRNFFAGSTGDETDIDSDQEMKDRQENQTQEFTLDLNIVPDDEKEKEKSIQLDLEKNLDEILD